GALDRAADVARARHRAGDDVHLGFEPHAAHADRVLDAVLVVDDEFLRDDVDDLAIGGDGDRLRGLDHALHVGGRDLVVLARHRHDAAAVQAADVVAGDAGVHALGLHAGHALGLLDRARDARHGLLEVDDGTAAQALARGVAHAHDAQLTGLALVGD